MSANEPQQFKRGQRVRYVGNLLPHCTGKTGLVSNINRAGIYVRFYGEGYAIRCFPCNLERLRKGETK